MVISSRTTVIALVICIVLAGCVGGSDNETQTTTVGEVNPTTAVSDGSTVSPTDTTNAPITTERSESHPLSDGEIAADHAAVLRDAGNFTIQTNTTVRGSGEDEFGVLNSTVMADVYTGEVLSRLTTTRVDSQVTYVTPNGEVYQRMEIYKGGSPEYQQPPSGYGVDKYVESAPRWFLNAYDYTYDGTTTLDDEPVHVYSVTSVEQLTNRSATSTRYDPDNVTDIDIQLFVTEAGLVRKLTYRLERESEGDRVTITRKKTYTGLGATAVETPSWLDEAKAAVESRTTVPDPGQRVERTIRDESLGVAVTVIGPKYAFDASGQLEIERQTGGLFDTGGDGYRTAQVSTLVEVEFPLVSDVNVTHIELSYNESAVPDGDEAGLNLYRFNWTRQTFVPVENTVDTEDDVVRADVQREGTYLVMHTPTWRELFR